MDNTADALLQRALALHEAGDLVAAQQAYAAVLAVAPNDINTLTNLGLLHLQRGEAAECVRYIEQSVALYPNQPRALVDLGDALRDLARFAEALAAYDRAIALQPGLVEAHEGRARTLIDLQRFAEAAISCGHIIALKPQSAYAYNLLGFALLSSGYFTEAVASYDKVLALMPESAEILSDRGVSLMNLKRYEEALDSYDRAIALNPNVAAIHNNRGNVLKDLRRYEEALAAYDRALALEPDYADAHNNRALALNYLERFPEALIAVDHALMLQPNFPEAHSNRGIVLRGLARHDEALAAFDRALELKPNVGNVYWNKSMLLLLLGRQEEGWALYEWRWKSDILRDCYRPFAEPLWLGDAPVAGKTILIYAEQGFGDFIQFCRYVPSLEAMGARVILETPSPLLPVIATLSPTAILIPKGAPLPPFDLQCPIMSLPHAFRTGHDSVPASIPYLAVDAGKRAAWAARLGPKNLPRIGLAWSGSASHTNDHTRSMKLAALAPLLQQLPCEFHSLQKEVRSPDQETLSSLPQLRTHAEALSDFADTAALIEAMDLVITVDTSVAHLAGALGKPVWVLVATTPDYRWMFEREDTPWYPTARLFRQTKSFQWADVVARVITAASALFPSLSAGEWVNRGEDFRDCGQFAQALDCYDRAIALALHHIGARKGRICALIELKRFTDAIAECGRVLALAPEDAYTYNFLAFALMSLGYFAEAVANYDHVLALEPNSPDIWSDRAVALVQLKRFDEALASYDRALTLKSDYAKAHSNRAVALSQMDRLEEALASAEHALTLDPDLVDAHNNRGLVLRSMKRLDEALESYDEALARAPDVGNVNWNKAILLLLRGEFAEGWKLYEWRWKSDSLAHTYRPFAQPLWLGETPLAGKTILIHREQGFGDFIQGCRYVPLLEKMGAQVVIEAHASLLPLLRTLSPTMTLVVNGDPLPAFDVHCPVLSLPLAFSTTLETVPAAVPYLHADAAKYTAWTQKLGAKTRVRIGIAWCGSATHGNDHNRTIAFAALAPLLQLPFEFHALQKEFRAADHAAIAAAQHLRLHADDLHDFADTAALIMAMDLVITVDTSVAHLAGALGKPVWLLLPYIPDYRWLLEREDSPWYPTMRLFRQPTRGDWASVVARVVDALAAEDNPLTNEIDRAAIYKSRGLALSAQRQFTEAIALYDEALAHDADDAESHLNRGIALRELGRFAEALASYDRAIALAPDMALAHERRAMALVKLARYEEAIASCERALALNPQSANVYNILGRAQYHLGRHAEALASYNHVLTLAPNAAEIYCDRAVVLVQLRREAEALASFDRALTLDPDDAATYNNRGNLRREMGMFDAAMEDYNRALALEPELADALWNKAQLLLLLGDFAQGNALYEWRWKSIVLKKQNMRHPAEPLWLGETAIAGKRLLIHPEQGYGDFIQLCRYVPQLVAMGAQVILETPQALMPVIKTLGPGFTLLEKGAALPPIDYHCPIMSLPLAMGTTLETIPNPGPYLSADLAKCAIWQRKLGAKTRPRIGLVWSGSATHANDHNRSIALAALASLLQLPLEFHALQKELRPADEVALAKFPTLHLHADDLRDFADTAALLMAMDLVITVDTSVAHLAGALGKPVWVLLPRIPDYRWLMGRADSPWYTTARLFRKTGDDWTDVIENVCENLKSLH